MDLCVLPTKQKYLLRISTRGLKEEFSLAYVHLICTRCSTLGIHAMTHVKELLEIN